MLRIAHNKLDLLYIVSYQVWMQMNSICSSQKARNDFIRTIHHTMHENIRRISIASLKSQAGRMQLSLLRQHVQQHQQLNNQALDNGNGAQSSKYLRSSSLFVPSTSVSMTYPHLKNANILKEKLLQELKVSSFIKF